MLAILDLRSVHPGLTGIGRYAHNLFLSLEEVKSSWSFVVLTTPAGREYFSGSALSDVREVGSTDEVWDQLQLPDLLTHLNADIYHSPLFVLPSVRACEYICTVHDVIPAVRPDLTSDTFSEFFFRHIKRSLKAASQVITVSDTSKLDLMKRYECDEHKITTVYEPVSPIFQRANIKDHEGDLSALGLSSPYLLFVGAIDKRKNVRRLIDAYDLLLQDRNGAPDLVIVGQLNSEAWDLQREVRMRNLQNRVRFLGRIPDRVLGTVYSRALLFVFPSLYEGFGLPVVEAMAAGIPVLASRTSSIPEVAGNAALLVDPEDTVSIKSGIGRLLDDSSLRSALIAKGLSQAARYDLKSQGASIIGIYDRIYQRVG